MKIMKHVLSIIFIMIFYQANAQNNPPFKRLYIGDTVPMESIVFNTVRNYPGGKAKLSDFKGKYIILDFWNRSCSVCIGSIPKMEQLQEQFKENLQVLMVTNNSEKELSQLFRNSTNLKNTKLPIVIADSILYKVLFAHNLNPYHVWLDRDGKVVATTFNNETNAENVRTLISGKEINVAVKESILDEKLIKDAKNEQISLLKVGDGLLHKYLKYYAQIPLPKITNRVPEVANSIFKSPYYSMFMQHIPDGYIDGVTYINNDRSIFKDENGKPKGIKAANASLRTLYEFAFVNPGINISKIIIEGRAKDFYEEKTDSTNVARYYVNNSYCYESALPEYSFESARKLLQQDLVRFFGMTGNVEDKPVNCLVLYRLGTAEEKNLWMKDQNIDIKGPLFKKGGNGIEIKFKIKSLLSVMASDNQGLDDPIVFDETTFNNEEQRKSMDMFLKLKNFHGTSGNIPLMQQELAKYGLGLRQESRELKVLVLRNAL